MSRSPDRHLVVGRCMMRSCREHRDRDAGSDPASTGLIPEVGEEARAAASSRHRGRWRRHIGPGARSPHRPAGASSGSSRARARRSGRGRPTARRGRRARTWSSTTMANPVPSRSSSRRPSTVGCGSWRPTAGWSPYSMPWRRIGNGRLPPYAASRPVVLRGPPRQLVDQAAGVDGVLDHACRVRQPLLAVGVEEPVDGETVVDEAQLPCEVRGVTDARAEPLAEERRHLVGGIAGDEDPTGRASRRRPWHGTGRRPPGSARRRPGVIHPSSSCQTRPDRPSRRWSLPVGVGTPSAGSRRGRRRRSSAGTGSQTCCTNRGSDGTGRRSRTSRTSQSWSKPWSTNASPRLLRMRLDAPSAATSHRALTCPRRSAP